MVTRTTVSQPNMPPPLSPPLSNDVQLLHAKQHTSVASLVIQATNLECFALQHAAQATNTYLGLLNTFISIADRLQRLHSPGLWRFACCNGTLGLCATCFVPSHPECDAQSLLQYFLQLRRETSKVTLPDGQPLQLKGCLHAVASATTAIVGERLHFDVTGPVAIVPLHMISHVKPGELLVTEAALEALGGKYHKSSSWVRHRVITLCSTHYQTWVYKSARIAGDPVSKEVLLMSRTSTGHAARAIKTLQQGARDQHDGISMVSLSFATRAINARYERWLAEQTQCMDILVLCLRMLSLLALLRMPSILWLRGMVVATSRGITLPLYVWLPLVCCTLCVLWPALLASTLYHRHRQWLLPLHCICTSVCNAYLLVPWLLRAAAPDSPAMVLHLLARVTGVEVALGNAMLTMPFSKHVCVHVACLVITLPLIPWVCSGLPPHHAPTPECINLITMGWQVLGGLVGGTLLSYLLQLAFVTRFSYLDVLARAQQPRAQHQQVLDKWAADIKALEMRGGASNSSAGGVGGVGGIGMQETGRSDDGGGCDKSGAGGSASQTG